MSRKPPLNHAANCLNAFDDGHYKLANTFIAAVALVCVLLWLN